MSNKFSSKRRLLKRPKVCKPPPPDPKEKVTCEIDPDNVEGDEGDTVEVEAFATRDSMPPESIVTVEIVTDTGINGDTSYENEEGGALLEILLDQEAGEYVVAVVFTWEDDVTCSKPLAVTIHEPP